MQNKYQEVNVLIVAGSILALVLVGFIVTILFMYRKKQFIHEQELLQTRLEIQENIFKEISEELHDNIGQILTVLKLTLSSLSVSANGNDLTSIQESKEMVGTIMQSISDLSKSLSPGRISKIGIAEALRFELEKIEKTKFFKTSLSISDFKFNLSAEKEIFLFRIIQEILTNIIKHSKAKTIHADISGNDQSIYLTFSDDGVGFNVAEVLNSVSSQKGIGLINMMNRASLIGGKIKILSEKGEGTTIKIELRVI
jgi:two-component system NarL family sensor kinase